MKCILGAHNLTTKENANPVDEIGTINWSDIREVAIDDTSINTRLELCLKKAGEDEILAQGVFPETKLQEIYVNPAAAKARFPVKLSSANGVPQGEITIQLKFTPN